MAHCAIILLLNITNSLNKEALMQQAMTIFDVETKVNPTSRSVSSLVRELKSKNEDYEYYPTCQSMIECVRADLKESFSEYQSNTDFSMLDCGAGTGAVLNQLFEGKKYAIEKSEVLIKEMPEDIIVVGCEFESQSLLDLKVSALFSNPPYSQFIDWTIKIITEAYASVAYLVIPERWKNSLVIKQALKSREAEATVIGSFRFDGEDSERKARGTVDIVRISFACKSHNGKLSKMHVQVHVDPFALWVKEHFKMAASTSQDHKADIDKDLNARMQAEINQNGAMVESKGLVAMMETFYNKDMDKLISNYQKVSSFDPEIAKEFGISIDGITTGLKMKIAGLKKRYWTKLFNSLDKVTCRLCVSTRKKLLNELTENVFVDFTASNVHSVLIWVMKKANTYYDEQFVNTFEKLVCESSIVNYKSNKKMFGDEGWSYNIHMARANVHNFSLTLEHRIVAEGAGGRNDSGYSSSATHGLSNNAINFINDLLVVAYNLGFDTSQTTRADKTQTQWDGKKKVFHYRDITTGKDVVLFEVKAFYNGNLHFKFKPEFVCKMNVVFGKLKGWVKSHQEAAEEMDIDVNIAKQYFGSQFKLSFDNANNLLVSARKIV
ncbi:MAG: DUF4942 domain-containing protein [Endozoicomonadaceae bacterium]|nr:DUF4942 domain-containing protein [Endozoicomonadaceae bacterium]